MRYFSRPSDACASYIEVQEIGYMGAQLVSTVSPPESRPTALEMSETSATNPGHIPKSRRIPQSADGEIKLFGCPVFAQTASCIHPPGYGEHKDKDLARRGHVPCLDL